jgi:hypothetical protein
MVRKNVFTLASVAFCCAFAARLSAQTPWIHVEVEETGAENSHVKVNLPLSVVEIAADAAPEKLLPHGRLDLGHLDHDIEVEDLRRMWQALRDAGDEELVSVEGDDESVAIRRDGEQVIIDVNDAQGSENVRVQVPVTVIDALLSGDGNELDVRAALEQLRKSKRGEVIRVDDDETRVRIWIDERD